MGLPASCAAACLLRNAWSHSSLLEVHMGQAGKKVASWQAMNTVSQGPLGPALSKTHVDCVEGLLALLLESLGGTMPTSASVLKIANSGELGPHHLQTGCVVPTPMLLRQL